MLNLSQLIYVTCRRYTFDRIRNRVPYQVTSKAWDVKDSGTTCTPIIQNTKAEINEGSRGNKKS